MPKTVKSRVHSSFSKGPTSSHRKSKRTSALEHAQSANILIGFHNRLKEPPAPEDPNRMFTNKGTHARDDGARGDRNFIAKIAERLTTLTHGNADGLKTELRNKYPDIYSNNTIVDQIIDDCKDALTQRRKIYKLSPPSPSGHSPFHYHYCWLCGTEINTDKKTCNVHHY